MVSNEQIADKKKACNVNVMPEGQILFTETIDTNGNWEDPPGGCEPGPYPRYRLSIQQQNLPALEATEDKGPE